LNVLLLGELLVWALPQFVRIIDQDGNRKVVLSDGDLEPTQSIMTVRKGQQQKLRFEIRRDSF